LTLHEPIVILSDLHLSPDHWQEEFRRFADLWRDAGTLVLNGDTLPTYRMQDETRVRDTVAGMKKMVAADGATLVFLGGNADFRSNWDRAQWAAGGRVLMTHGHAVFKGISPWHPWRRRFTRARMEAREQLRKQAEQKGWNRLAWDLAAVDRALRTVHDQYVKGFRRVCTAMYWRPLRLLLQPWLVGRLLWSWRRAPDWAASYLATFAPRASVIVMGHTHRAGVWRRAERLVVNTGSPRGPGRCMMAIVHAGRLEVRRIRRKGRRWAPGTLVFAAAIPPSPRQGPFGPDEAVGKCR
jgi:predicted phosphodiesterase